jgi:putative DNA primase/helicase
MKAPNGNPEREPADSDCLAAALDYAALEWPVFPVWWIKNGKCACGKADCQHPGKHPIGKLAPNGRNSATTDPETIKRWWGQCPEAHIGIPTGPESGLVVLDVDPRHGGDVNKLPGNMPLTPTAFTGGGGEHYYMQHPGDRYIKSVSAFGGYVGIDLKADGGYIVAPPSRHISGGTYSWKIPPEGLSHETGPCS